MITGPPSKLTDRTTDDQTTTVSLAAHTRQGIINATADDEKQILGSSNLKVLSQTDFYF